MYKLDYGFYIGQETDEVKVDFIVQDNVFIIIEYQNISKEQIQFILDQAKEQISKQLPTSLDQFENFINQYFYPDQNQPFAFAGALIVDNIVYLITRQNANINLYRKNKLINLINSDNSASGYINQADWYILSSKQFDDQISNHLSQEDLNNSTPKQVIENITPKIKEHDDTGSIALFLKISQEKQVLIDSNNFPIESEQNFKVKDKITSFITKLKTRKPTKKSRILNLLAIIFIVAILLYSVVFGIKRHKRNQLIEQVNNESVKISRSLNEANELIEINPEKASGLINQAQADLKALKKIVGQENLDQFGKLESQINQQIKQIKKQQDKSYQEFFDLEIIAKKAGGDSLFFANNQLIILDQKNSNIYRLDVNEKSHQTYSNKGVKESCCVASYNEKTFFVSQSQGIYSFDDSKVSQEIKADQLWGRIIDFWVYNGNLYLLDQQNDEIYKYLVAEQGYSNTISYFQKGQTIDLSKAKSIAIDSSIYILTDDKIYKYSSGQRQSFNISLPKPDVSFDQIFTNSDLDQLYLLSKNKSSIYIFSKSGSYEKQIISSILDKAQDFVVINDPIQALVLNNNKLYSIPLD